MAALRASAEAAGLEVAADIGGLRVRVPHLLMLPRLAGALQLALLAIVLLVTLFSGLETASTPGAAALVMGVVCVGGGLGLGLAYALLRWLRQGFLYQSVVLSPHAVLIQGQSIPLESIAAVSAHHGLWLLWLRLHLRDGQRLTLVRSDQPTSLLALHRLLASAHAARVAQLQAVGEDPYRPRAAPEALQTLRGVKT